MAGICKSVTNTVKFGAQAAASSAEVLALGSLTVVEVAKPFFTAVQEELPKYTETTKLAVHTASIAYRNWVLPKFVDANNDSEIEAWIMLSDETKEKMIKAYEEAALKDAANIYVKKGFSEQNGVFTFNKPVPPVNP